LTCESIKTTNEHLGIIKADMKRILGLEYDVKAIEKRETSQYFNSEEALDFKSRLDDCSSAI